MVKKLTTDEFIKRVKEIHGDKYDYSKTEYKNSRSDVIIICKKHGPFNQTASSHLSGRNCKKCKYESMGKSFRKDLNSFILESNKIHNYLYDYSNVKYKSAHDKVDIICKIHGTFKQTPHEHLKGYGCIKCRNEMLSFKYKIDTHEFIDRSVEVHGYLYDYSRVNYEDCRTPIIIICKKHGSFNQIPYYHIQGRGCPKCSSSKGEEKISKILSDIGVEFEVERKFEHCRAKNALPFDFYIPSKNLLIEYDGIQHFESIDVFGGESQLKTQKYYDLIKTRFAKSNNIKLLRIPYYDYENIENILKKEL